MSLARIFEELTAALSLWDQQPNLITNLFTFKTTESFALLPTDPDNSAEFEKASQFGNAKAARPDVDHFRMGFPLERKTA